jgi:hypothetical protein
MIQKYCKIFATIFGWKSSWGYRRRGSGADSAIRFRGRLIDWLAIFRFAMARAPPAKLRRLGPRRGP